MQDDIDQNEETIKSKSQLKREMLALQGLGEVLVKLSSELFEKITLPEELYDAIAQARSIQQHGARKRQLQYIGRLMRNLDPTPIQEQLDSVLGQSKQAAQTLHQVERWRDRLLEDGDLALEELVNEYPKTDRQYVRQLLRNTKKEKLENKPSRSFKALFRYLRDLSEENSQTQGNNE